MIFLTGDTRGRRQVRLLRKHGWGRMVIDQRVKLYPAEPWGFDNGAYRDFRQGKGFDADRYKKAIDMALRLEEDYWPPYMVVVPDIVCGGKRSLEMSLKWAERLPAKWPLYLVVQNGMIERDLEDLDGIFTGMFLGGDNKFKATALCWCRFAKGRDMRFHYGRCGTLDKIQHAKAVGADSADSALPLWMDKRLADLLSYLNAPLDEMQDLYSGCVYPEYFVSAAHGSGTNG